MNGVLQGAAITLIVFGVVFTVWSLVGLTMNERLPWEKVNRTYLRGFKYGDVVTLASSPIRYPVMVLSVRIENPTGRLPVEHVTTIHLSPASTHTLMPFETMASIWRKVDDA